MLDAYHTWYYDSKVWMTTTWLGVPARKSVQDLWLHQEIIADLRPELVVECGVRFGGSTLYYATVLDQTGAGRIVGVDVDLSNVADQVRIHPRVELWDCSSTDPTVADRVADCAGPVFVILDSDHSRDHVYAELESFTPALKPGDYLIVEDSNVNGHPVLPDWGPGPWEALEDYLEARPGVYRRDVDREEKFGWTFAPGGFLIRI